MASSIELLAKNFPAFLLSLPINMIYGQVARAVLGSVGDIGKKSLERSAELVEGLPGQAAFEFSAWVPWGDVLPLITYGPALVTAYSVWQLINSKTG